MARNTLAKTFACAIDAQLNGRQIRRFHHGSDITTY